MSKIPLLRVRICSYNPLDVCPHHLISSLIHSSSLLVWVIHNSWHANHFIPLTSHCWELNKFISHHIQFSTSGELKFNSYFPMENSLSFHSSQFRGTPSEEETFGLPIPLGIRVHLLKKKNLLAFLFLSVLEYTFWGRNLWPSHFSRFRGTPSEEEAFISFKLSYILQSLMVSYYYQCWIYGKFYRKWKM